MLTSNRSELREVESTVPSNGQAKRISLPEPRTLLTAAAIAGGAIGTGIVVYYYMRARRNTQRS